MLLSFWGSEFVLTFTFPLLLVSDRLWKMLSKGLAYQNWASWACTVHQWGHDVHSITLHTQFFFFCLRVTRTLIIFSKFSFDPFQFSHSPPFLIAPNPPFLPSLLTVVSSEFASSILLLLFQFPVALLFYFLRCSLFNQCFCLDFVILGADLEADVALGHMDAASFDQLENGWEEFLLSTIKVSEIAPKRFNFNVKMGGKKDWRSKERIQDSTRGGRQVARRWKFFTWEILRKSPDKNVWPLFYTFKPAK